LQSNFLQFTQPRRKWLVVALAVILVLITSFCTQLYLSYQQHIRSIDRDLESLSLSLIKQAESEFRATELALRFARSKLQQIDHPDNWTSQQVYDMFRDVISTFNATEDSASPHDLFWADSKGLVKVTSYSNPTPEMPAADRDYFLHHRQYSTPDVYYSGTLQSRLTARWVIYQTVRLNDSRGNFAGVIGITTRIESFEVFYQQLGLQPGSSIILSHLEGRWTYRFPFKREYADIDFISSPDFRYMMQHKQGRTTIQQSPYDGKKRRAGFYLGSSSKLLASVTLSQEAVNEQFYPVLRQRGMLMSGILFILVLSIYFYDRANKRSSEAMRLANVDELTQLPNRRSLDDRLSQEWRLLKRAQKPLGLLYIDIDYFKKYNDYYGHDAGDRCLSRVAQSIEQILKRPGDFVARYGGEEFIVLLPGNNYDKTAAVARTILDHIRADQIPHSGSPAGPYLSVSIGYAAMIPRGEDDIARLKEWADKALYGAKNSGRDRIQGFNPQTSLISDLTRQQTS
jgi:diguanylate cyclase (GGDEF)-like protein